MKVEKLEKKWRKIAKEFMEGAQKGDDSKRSKRKERRESLLAQAEISAREVFCLSYGFKKGARKELLEAAAAATTWAECMALLLGAQSGRVVILDKKAEKDEKDEKAA
jgi:hypothetical protein